MEVLVPPVTTMTDVLFIQGASAGAHAADARLVASLKAHLGPDYTLHYPRMPDEDDPTYPGWSAAFSQALAALAPPFVLVAHSLGASFMLRYMSLNRIDPAPLGVFLISTPFIGEHGWPGADFELPADAGKALAGMNVFVFQGSGDETVPAAHATLYEKMFSDVTVRRLPGRDHQLNDDLDEIAATIRRTCPAS